MRYVNMTDDELIREARDSDDALVVELTKRLALANNKIEGERSQPYGSDTQENFPLQR